MYTLPNAPKYFKQPEPQLPQEMLRCPNTDQYVQVTDWQHFPVLSGQISWWRCTACNGWHVVMKDIDR